MMATATNETSSVAETVGEGPTATTATTAASVVKEEGNTETRPSSPDPSCPICLDNVTDAAYTDMCCHRFCFNCLVSWSRVKPECPLCKQRFSLIIHNVRSIGDYDELPVTWTEAPPPSLDANFFISVAFQRPRFRYRSTGGWGWRFHDVLAGPSSHVNSNPLLPVSTLPDPVSTPVVSSPLIIPSTTPHVFPPESSNTFMGNTVATEWRRRRQVSASEFRSNIYRQNQWVCPPQPRNGVPYRVRECSPLFYRNNPAQLNRLLPWLHRELLVLLDVWDNYEDVCHRVLHAITNIPIRSPRFQALMWPYLHERTSHFIHEFYNFAISAFDMLAYDLRAEYVRRSPGYNSPLASETENNSDSSDIEVIETPAPRPELIEISDDEDEVQVEEGANDSDASVEIISTLPPLALREPEIIDLVDDSGDSDVEHNPIDNGQRTHEIISDAEPSVTAEELDFNLFSPSVVDRKERVGERLRNKYQPYYKDESSTSEEETPRRRQVRKKKRKSEPPKKRKRIIENSSSSDSDCNQEVKERLQLSAGELRQTRSRTKCKSSSTTEDKYSSNKSSSSVSTVESTGRSRFSERRKKSLIQPSTSHKDKTRLPETTKNNSMVKKEVVTSECASISSPPTSYSPDPYSLPNVSESLKQNNLTTTKNINLMGFKWSPHLSSGSEEEVHVNHSTLDSSISRTPSPKPRLRSVVRKIEPSEEAGCSSWPLHNLRQRKITRYAYTPYFSTSESDS